MAMASLTLLYPLALTLLLTLTLLGDRTHLLSSCLATLIMVFSHSSLLHPSSSFSFFPQVLGFFPQALGFTSEGFFYTRTRSKHRGEV